MCAQPGIGIDVVLACLKNNIIIGGVALTCYLFSRMNVKVLNSVVCDLHECYTTATTRIIALRTTYGLVNESHGGDDIGSVCHTLDPTGTPCFDLLGGMRVRVRMRERTTSHTETRSKEKQTPIVIHTFC
jgi:hypothetical protein